MSEATSSTMDNMSAPEISISDKKHKTTADADSLTADLIEQIAAKATSIEDFVRFGAVRKSWRLATLTVKSKLDYMSLNPLLMVGEKTPAESSGRFYSISTGERFQIELPGIGGPCWGSPFGWVCVEFRLINPLTGASINLPIYRRKLGQIFVRTVLTASPDDPDCIFFSINFKSRVLHCLRPGDRDFSRVDYTHGWSDIIRLEGNFYGCLCDGKVLLLSIDESPGSPERTESSGSPERTDYSSDDESLVSLVLTAAEFAAAPPELVISSSAEEVPAVLDVKYLVDLGGELCMVIRYARPRDNAVTISKFGFEIFKLDICTKNWERVLSLGDKSIFVGANYSYSMRASSSSRLKPNCVYFTDDFSWFKDNIDYSAFEDSHWYSTSKISDMGIYDIENDQVTAFTTILSVSDEELQSPYFSPIWFTPKLQ